jgi:hypothetical protein
MKTKSFRSTFAGVVVTLILLGCSLTQLRNPTLTPMSETTSEPTSNATLLPPTANRNPVLTGIQSPAEGSSFSPNSTIPVNITFDSQKPVQLVQVYLDGEAIDWTVPDPLAQTATFQIPGAALQGEGVHTLMVMTYDTDGRGAFSNVVHVSGIPAEPVAYKLTAKKGDSLQAFAEGIQVNLDDLLTANPKLATMGSTSGTQTLPEDTTLIVNLGTPPASQPFSGKPPGQVKYAAGIPIPPSATAQVGGCDAQVTVSGKGTNLWDITFTDWTWTLPGLWLLLICLLAETAVPYSQIKPCMAQRSIWFRRITTMARRSAYQSWSSRPIPVAILCKLVCRYPMAFSRCHQMSSPFIFISPSILESTTAGRPNKVSSCHLPMERSTCCPC